jgi:hypothetical protein
MNIVRYIFSLAFPLIEMESDPEYITQEGNSVNEAVSTFGDIVRQSKLDDFMRFVTSVSPSNSRDQWEQKRFRIEFTKDTVYLPDGNFELFRKFFILLFEEMWRGRNWAFIRDIKIVLVQNYIRDPLYRLYILNADTPVPVVLMSSTFHFGDDIRARIEFKLDDADILPASYDVIAREILRIIKTTTDIDNFSIMLKPSENGPDEVFPALGMIKLRADPILVSNRCFNMNGLVRGISEWIQQDSEWVKKFYRMVFDGKSLMLPLAGPTSAIKELFLFHFWKLWCSEGWDAYKELKIVFNRSGFTTVYIFIMNMDTVDHDGSCLATVVLQAKFEIGAYDEEYLGFEDPVRQLKHVYDYLLRLLFKEALCVPTTHNVKTLLKANNGPEYEVAMTEKSRPMWLEI